MGKNLKYPPAFKEQICDLPSPEEWWAENLEKIFEVWEVNWNRLHLPTLY